MTDHPSFLDGKASLPQATPDLEQAYKETPATFVPCSQGSQPDRDGGMACFVLNKASGKKLSWRSTLWGSPSMVCLPVSQADLQARPASTPARRPLVLLSEGLGITPMIAMAQFLMEQVHRQVDVHFIHESSGDKEAPFLPDMYAWNLSPHFTLHLRQPSPRQPLRAPMSHGHVDTAFLKALRLPEAAEYYVCGAEAFTERCRDALHALGVDTAHIHVASIGPAPAAPSFGRKAFRAELPQQKTLARQKEQRPSRFGFLAFFFSPLMQNRRFRQS